MGDPLKHVRYCGWPIHEKPTQAFSTVVIYNYDVPGEEYHYHLCDYHEKTINQILDGILEHLAESETVRRS